MISADRTQEIFKAIYLHLATKNYNYEQYNGRVKKQPTSYYAERFAYKLFNKRNVVLFFIANFFKVFESESRVATFIGEFYSKESFRYYDELQGMLSSRSYLTENFLKEFYRKEGSFNKLYHFDVVIEYYFNKQVSLPILAYITKSLDLDKKWETIDPLHQETMKFLIKGKIFFPKEKSKILEIMRKAKLYTV